MLLPNKLFSFNESVLSNLAIVLNALESPCTLPKLFELTKEQISDPLDLIDTLYCLFALKKIKITNDEVLEKC